MLPLALYSPVLAYVMISDLRRMRIPNWTALAAIAVFAIAAPSLGYDEATRRLVVAVFVFLIGFGLFALRIVAGGDVKSLAALMLMIPSASLSLFGLVFSGSLLLATLTVMSLQQSPLTRHSRWLGLRAKGHMPMGVAIGCAGLGHLALVMNLA